eukprot:3550969-Rhodomonas_salina.3
MSQIPKFQYASAWEYLAGDRNPRLFGFMLGLPLRRALSGCVADSFDIRADRSVAWPDRGELNPVFTGDLRETRRYCSGIPTPRNGRPVNFKI